MAFVDHSRPSVDDAQLRISYLDPTTLARGHVVIDSLANPSYAGVRVQRQLRPELLMTLARQRSLRYNLARVPLVGAQLGLEYDPKAPDCPEVLGRFLSALRPFLQTSMSLGPDANVGDELLSRVIAHEQLPPRMHAIQARQGWPIDRWSTYQALLATEVGPNEPIKDLQTAYCAADAAHAVGAQLLRRELTVAVLGSGPYGRRIARYLDQRGVRVVALGDSVAALYNKNGLLRDILDADNLVDADSRSALYITGDEFFGLPVDVLIAASTEDVVEIHNVGRLRCALVIEAATHAVTADAETVLTARGIPVLPSFVATVGPVFLTDGVLRGTVVTAAEALDCLNRASRMTASEVVRLSTSLNLSLREAALRLAFHHQFEKHPLRKVSHRMRTLPLVDE